MSEIQKGALNKVAALWKLIPDVLQLDRLERLAKKNSVVAMAYAELIMHINFVLLTWDRDTEFKAGPVESLWDFFFPKDQKIRRFKGSDPIEKLSALGFCFAHSAGKLDETISIDNFSQFSVGMDKLLDFVGSAVSASKVEQKVAKE